MAAVGASNTAVQQGEGLHLREGCRVELSGLSIDDLNGQRERWPVAVDGTSRELSRKRNNLKFLTSCAHCGAEKVAAALKKCTRCRAVHYCNGDCQRAHWKRGGHKQACREQFACTICLDDADYPLPIQCGCGCRHAAGCAHVACKAEYAAHRGPGFHAGWLECPTCKQNYTGAMQLGLAESLLTLLQGRATEDHGRLCAQTTLAIAFMEAGRYTQAKALYQNVLATRRRVDGPNDTNTLVVAGNLGNILLYERKYSEAEALFRDTLERQQESLGPDNENTLHTSSNLAASLQNQDKFAEAEPVLRTTLVIQQRVLGKDHLHTLGTADNLASLLVNTGQHVEAEELGRGTLAQANRTLGPEHPHSLSIACTLASSLGQTVEAESLLMDTLAAQQRVLGPQHPQTQDTAQWLQCFW